jgi:hypothetical protein
MAKKRKRASAGNTKRRRSRADVKRILEAAFRDEFPEDTVDISDGYKDNIHVLVVSRQFDGMQEQAKQDRLWGIIDGTGLTEAEKTLISLVMPLSPAEIK